MSPTPHRGEYRFPRLLWGGGRQVVNDSSVGAESQGEARVPEQWEEL